MPKVLVVVGTRPNFIKITQFRRAAQAFPGVELKIVHTGQHFDEKMADVFFKQFDLTPDYFLGIGPSSPIKQMEEIRSGLEKICVQLQPDVMVVTGDVNSTLAAAETANKLNIKLAHVESGLRSFDSSMPEEHNRIVTDRLSDILFVTEKSGLENLANEGMDASRVHFVGNTMIDTMVAYKDKIGKSEIRNTLGIGKLKFVLMTMHRPATVDDPAGLRKLIELIAFVSEKYKVVFPIHPRTIKMATEFGLADKLSSIKGLIRTEPLDYFAFQHLILHCSFILTDSGGIQEESTFAGIPCLTLRPNTERPVTVDIGTNELVPFDLDIIRNKIDSIQNGSYKKGRIPELWDGKASERVMMVLSKLS